MPLFGRKKSKPAAPPEEEDDQQSVLFKGAVSGVETDLSEHAKLVRVGLPRAKSLVSDALARRAEKIRLDPKDKAAQIGMYVDGMPFSGGRVSVQEAMAITQILKLLAGLDPKDRTRPLRGGINAEFDEQDYEIGIETRPLRTGGERLTIRLENAKTRIESPTDAGFPDALREKIRELSAAKSGLLLIAGPPDSGVTTTSLAVLRSIDAYLFNIFNVADLGGREIIHIANFRGEEGDSLEQLLARTIRKEADVAYVDPIDEESATVVSEAAEEMCLVGEMAAAGAAAAVIQFGEWVGSPAKAAESIRGVFSPKLIRKLCTNCREAYRPNPKLLAKVGLPPETTALYRQPKQIDEETGKPVPVACNVCGGLGYYGRTVMVELIEMTDAMKEIVADGGSVADIKNVAKEAGMLTHRSEGVRLVAEGITSLEELQRAFSK